MQIELRPHLGFDSALNRQVDLGQDRIFVDNLAVGFVGRRPDAKILLTQPLPHPDAEAAIVKEVRRKYGGDQIAVVQPPPEPRPDLLDDDEVDDDSE